MAKKKRHHTYQPQRQLAAQRQHRFIQAVLKSRAPIIHRKDISDWQNAKQSALRVEGARYHYLQELYDYIMDDAHLTSQVLLRKSKVLRSEFALLREGGDIDEEASDRFANMPATRALVNAIIDAKLYGYSVVELNPQPDQPDPLALSVIDRRHINPKEGIVLIDTSDTNGIEYRKLREYGTFILEFRGEGLGLLDKAVPHVLFKRFAQSCWSEFCEVCGMPPRVIKTNTQDPELRNQYLTMLSNYGTGANGIIDTDDELEFVATNASNGEAYENLIRVCSNELSLLINGAVIGQDTRYGSNSKEQTSTDLNDEIVNADLYDVEVAMNTIVLPALMELGFVPQGLRFRFREQEDTTQLFNQTIQAAQYFDIDPNWVKEKFGIEVLGPRQMGGLLPDPSDNSDNSDNSDKEDKKRPQSKEDNSYSPDFDPFV
ncbi:MAG: DUF935 family protein [Bacteroidales bacterium]|nr:DUF935 family protein [Bacteroidales bacterium]